MGLVGVVVLNGRIVLSISPIVFQSFSSDHPKLK